MRFLDIQLVEQTEEFRRIRDCLKKRVTNKQALLF